MTVARRTHCGRVAALVAALMGIMTVLEAQPVDIDAATLEQYRRERAEMAHRQRRIIFNNDGDDHLLRTEFSLETFLAQRSTPLIGSQVDTIVYCTSRPFGLFLHRTEIGDVFTEKDAFAPGRTNVVADFLELGTDPLEVMIEFCREHDFEIIWSMRMNDTHDSPHTPENPHYYWSSFKERHPDALLGARDRRPRHGSWVAVDYAHPAVREFLFQAFEELCRNYDLDGIEMDFYRHLVYFGTVAQGGHATPEEIEMMTDLVRRVRAMTEAEGVRRGKPILLTARVPDSVGFCMGMGLDIETWLEEGLLDVLVAGGDFRLNSWDYSVALGERYGIPVYADLDPSIPYGMGRRFDRNSLETLRGRALEAWDAGMSGIYLFNHFNPRHPLWWELGDPEALRRQDKLYFANVRGRSGYLKAALTLPGGEDFDNRPALHPTSPVPLTRGEAVEVPVVVAEDVGAARVTLHVLAGTREPLRAAINGHRLESDPAGEGWFDYPLTAEQVRRGENLVQLEMGDEPDEAGAWDVEYVCDTDPPTPWRHDRLTATTTATMQDGALLIADRGTEPGSYLYYVYPWVADRGELAVFEATAQVISGRSMIVVADGVAEEEVRLYPDRIELGRAGLSHEMDTTDAFRVYRVEIEGGDIRVYVDGALALDAPGRFVSPAHSGRNMAMFGASTSPTLGEALWQSVRLRTGTVPLHDLVLSVRYAALEDRAD